ncbi:hypothetical protein ACJX0J_022474, partial [Zea mays]
MLLLSIIYLGIEHVNILLQAGNRLLSTFGAHKLQILPLFMLETYSCKFLEIIFQHKLAVILLLAVWSHMEQFDIHLEFSCLAFKNIFLSLLFFCIMDTSGGCKRKGAWVLAALAPQDMF